MHKYSEVLLLNDVVNIVTIVHTALIYAASCLSFRLDQSLWGCC